jgi:hypothetical protein
MTQVIIYTNENGGVSVCYPTGELPIEEVKAKDTPAGSIIVDNDSLPNEHNEFFNAWELNGTTVTINLTKAKDIVKETIRIERAPVLANLDVQFMKAIESGNTSLQATIAEQKQELRDITTHSSIVGASDVVSLKTAMTTLIEQIKT